MVRLWPGERGRRTDIEHRLLLLGQCLVWYLADLPQVYCHTHVALIPVVLDGPELVDVVLGETVLQGAPHDHVLVDPARSPVLLVRLDQEIGHGELQQRFKRNRNRGGFSKLIDVQSWAWVSASGWFKIKT